MPHCQHACSQSPPSPVLHPQFPAAGLPAQAGTLPRSCWGLCPGLCPDCPQGAVQGRCQSACRLCFGIGYIASSVAAWAAVAFGFAASTICVFRSLGCPVKAAFRACWQFVAARRFSGVLETALRNVFVGWLGRLARHERRHRHDLLQHRGRHRQLRLEQACHLPHEADPAGKAGAGQRAPCEAGAGLAGGRLAGAGARRGRPESPAVTGQTAPCRCRSRRRQARRARPRR